MDGILARRCNAWARESGPSTFPPIFIIILVLASLDVRDFVHPAGDGCGDVNECGIPVNYSRGNAFVVGMAGSRPLDSKADSLTEEHGEDFLSW
ncbi:hypothetical protein AB0M72_27095 [Nocardiopsis dassonvillei]|uniref:hypothetical protein n=1 Tax=Nocardiopsis dassonvillei TaxID=2014 RepID=UPI0020108858|nr:hypothetical protein [Nocardiopsis dassonvillei]MCK9870181.1 hypothetical protein [Nocardiopsis dassonvillei]